MKEICRKIFLSILFLGIVNYAFPGEIKFHKKYREFQINNNNEIVNYVLLDPNETIKMTTIDIDTLIVYSRIVMDRKKQVSYKYEIRTSGMNKTVKRSSSASSTSKGLSGEQISKYNLYKRKMDPANTKLNIKNISLEKLLLKVSANNVTRSNKNIEYIKYIPAQHGEEEPVIIDEKVYTYFNTQNGKLQFTLEGPIILKIISRMICKNDFSENIQYKFSVIDNGKPIAVFNETAKKSKKAHTKENERIPSTGEINLIKLTAGIHKISIENNDLDRDVIFNLFISKFAIGLSEK